MALSILDLTLSTLEKLSESELGVLAFRVDKQLRIKKLRDIMAELGLSVDEVKDMLDGLEK